MIELFEYQQLLYATDGFSSTRLIGKGSHGWVYKAILDDNRVVAVKKPLSETHYSKVDNEARVLLSLRPSPLVVNFLGTTLDSPSYKNKLLVMEFMPNGSLRDLLLEPMLAPVPTTSWHKRLHIITQIARAVCFLHQANPIVIHRDIKAENILFDSNWDLKLADFGLAVSTRGGKSSRIISSRKPAGTIGYLDPSYTTASKLSTKSDVFSFGVVVLEVISGRKAMDISKSPASIVEWARPLIEQNKFEGIYDERMALPKWAERRLRKVVELAGRCVCAEQGMRPSMGEIVEAMEMEMSACYLCCIQFFQPMKFLRFRRRRRSNFCTNDLFTTRQMINDDDLSKKVNEN
ncbi:serine/threonine-protein kinase-like protein At5g23170 isoform X1 [Cucumis melo]|uniref:Serine/threonine-protein kinase-like protein At5g23170 isoform X1 n=1 Tax=Cucumis melo TaxID=3656 RepID=A0A1S3BEU9_CUCME|nr:serine/threonine-protein kinase-like protein At5g23170 isoform X1 [Cucumis melo]